VAKNNEEKMAKKGWVGGLQHENLPLLGCSAIAFTCIVVYL